MAHALHMPAAMTRTTALLLAAFASFASTAAAQTAPDTGRPVIVVEALIAPTAPAVVMAPQAVTAPTSAPLIVSAQYAAPQLTEAVEPERARPSFRTVGIGIGLFLGGYVLNIAGSALWSMAPFSWGSNGDFFTWSLVPIAGPIVQATTRDQGDLITAVLAVDALVQVAGLVTAIVGTVVRQRASRADEASLSFVPAVSRDVVGLTAMGTF